MPRDGHHLRSVHNGSIGLAAISTNLKRFVRQLFGAIGVAGDLSAGSQLDKMCPIERGLIELAGQTSGKGEHAIDFLDIACTEGDDLMGTGRPEGEDRITDPIRSAQCFLRPDERLFEELRHS